MAHLIVKDADNVSNEKDTEYAEECGICECKYNTPKALKCLHSFCLKCLDEKTNAGQNNVCCPTCDIITDLPSKGVEGLLTNYMLMEKQERRSVEDQLKDKEAIIPCTSCKNDTENKAVAWCRECQDYMCKAAVKYHNEQRITMLHEIISLETLQSEGIPSSSNSQKERRCIKHKDEKLKFYCETCETPFCRDCEVIDHPRGEDHVQVYLEDAVRKRSDDIKKEADRCKLIAHEVDDTIAQDEIVKAFLQKAVEQTLNDYDKASKHAHTKYSDNQNQHREKFVADLTGFSERRNNQLDYHKQELKNVRSRISSALAVAQMLEESGSQFDVADMYKDVISALRELSEFKPEAERCNKVSFKVNEECVPFMESLPAPGSFKLGIWEMKHEFGRDGDGKLTSARGLTFSHSGDLVVADHAAVNVKIFSDQGQFKSITANPGTFSYLFDVAFNPTTEECYVTDQTNIVKKFNGQIAYQSAITVGTGTMYGVSPTKTGGWAMCCYNQNLIYVYNNAGGQVKTVPVMQPWFIAVTSKDDFVITSNNQRSVQVIDKNNLVRTIGPPPNITDSVNWTPSGVCCSKDDEIFVSNRGNGKEAMGIYAFKLSGDYIDCVTTEVNNPWGLAMSPNGERLAVVNEDGLSVKMFGLN